MPQDLQILLALIGLGGGALGAAVTGLLNKIPAKGDTAKTIVTQVTVENARLIAENDRLSEENKDLRLQVRDGVRTGRIKDDYIHVLRGHIADEKDPPPPGYPEGMKQ